MSWAPPPATAWTPTKHTPPTRSSSSWNRVLPIANDLPSSTRAPPQSMPKSLTPRGIERLRDSPDRRARDAERLQTYRNMLGNNIIPNTAYSKCHAAAYHRWDKQVRQVIEAMDHTFRWGIYDRAPLNTWSTDRITLLGDAAHAVTPHLGQGANQAVEDAITLAVLLQDAQAADIPVRLRRYEDLRIERTRQVHDGSREAGALYRSTELSPGQQAERIVAINDRLQLDTHDAERIANDALAAVGTLAPPSA